MKLLGKLRFLLPLCLAVGACAQQPASAQAPTAPPPVAPQPPTAQQPSAAPEADHHITGAEAKELFRSLDEILKFASEHTGLPILHPVKKKLATREEVAKFIEKRMKEQGSGERFDHTSVALKRLGLLPHDFNLREYMLGLYKEQVEGWYDAHNKTAYLLDWVDPEAQKLVMAHELVHALQDQSFDLDKWLNVRDDSEDATAQMVLDEERTARQSVMEGQAMIVLYDYQLSSTGQTVESDPAIVDQMRVDMLEEDSSPMYARAPIYLREALLFPYSYGTDFVVAVLLKRGQLAAFAGVLEHPPLDTHQLMEPGSYLSGEPQMQVRVVALEKALGPEWRQDDFNGLGEGDLRVICRQWGGRDAAAKLAPAWRGGYYMTLAPKKAPKNAPVPLALLLNFTTADAAAQFAALYEAELPRRYTSAEATRSAPAEAARTPRQWSTGEGTVRLYVEGSRIIALESFTADEAEKLHAALSTDAKTFPIAATP